MENEVLVSNLKRLRLYHIPSTRALGDVRKVGKVGVCSFSWEDLRSLSDTPLSKDEIENFFHTLWLPFCAAMLLPETVCKSVKRIFPDPYQRPSDHNISAKGLCIFFVQRQQIVRAIAHMLTTTPLSVLIDDIARAGGADLSGVPIWWCPSIHDVGIMTGCLKHGYLVLNKFCADPDLPFTTDNIREHITRSFVTTVSGEKQWLSAAHGVFSTPLGYDQWLQQAMLTFPDIRDLEPRLVRIMTSLTSALPVDHFARVRPLQLPRGHDSVLLANNSSSADTEQRPVKNKKVLEVATNLFDWSEVNQVDLMNANSPYPAVPLHTFSEVTADRRRRFVRDLYYPE